MSDVSYSKQEIAIGPVGRNSLGWWAVLCFIVSEAALFGYLFFSYYYYAVQIGAPWYPLHHRPDFIYALPAVCIMILSGAPTWFAEFGARHSRKGNLLAGLSITIVLGLFFIGLQMVEWKSKPFTLSSNEYGSIFFIIEGAHLAHLCVGLLGLLMVLLWSVFGYFDERRTAPVVVVTTYWYFVIVVAIFQFCILYVTPYLRVP
ncbi:MAG: cytochrome c oxidase subunit 3 [Gammaproteobacteria bacterium]